MCSEVEVLLLRRFFWWKNTAENVQIFYFKSHDLKIHVPDLVGLCPNVTSMSVVFFFFPSNPHPLVSPLFLSLTRHTHSPLFSINKIHLTHTCLFFPSPSRTLFYSGSNTMHIPYLTLL